MTAIGPSRRELLDSSPWTGRWPGLRDAATEWLDGSAERLADARSTAEEILGTAFSGTGVLRIAQLAANAGPALAAAIRSGETDDLVQALADTALRGGPTYVKLGQLIASTRGIVPEWIADAFEGCRDAVPPAPATVVASVLRSEGIEEKLRSWDRRPVASASVAQVHHAVLRDGAEVVVKVRRPRIVQTVASDVSYLMPVLRLAERRPRARMANLTGMLDLMVRLFAQEVDLRLEAANTVEMAMALERAGLKVHVPAPVPGLVTKRVMALEYVEGTSWADAAAVTDFGHSGTDLVRVLMTGIVETTLVDGIFHGDLHPGNVFVDAQGLALLDYGIVGRLESGQRSALAALLLALIARDQAGVVRGLRDFGCIPPDVDVDAVAARLPKPPTDDEIRRMAAGSADMSDRFARVQRTLAEMGFRVVPEMALFARNLVYLSEAIATHAPGFDVVREVTAMALRMQGRGPILVE